MLPRCFRFNPRSQADFFVTAQSSRSRIGKWFWHPAETFQATVIVGKTAFPLATDRNRIKRRWRAAIAQVIQASDSSKLPQLQMAFLPNRQTMTWPLPEIVAGIHLAINSIKPTK